MHLKETHRYYIEKALKNKIPVAQIAKELGVHRSTIYREIEKGSFMRTQSEYLSDRLEYAYDVGQRVCDKRKHLKGRKKKLQPEDAFLLEVSDWILNERYSPEAALYKMPERKVCVKTLYNYIHDGHMKGVTVVSLPYAKEKRRKKGKVVKRLSRGTSIEQRPKYINDRSEYGHWEMDTVYSSKDDKTCLLVLSERKTREERIYQIKDRTAQSVIRALDRLERQIGTPAFRTTFKSITCDNGMEFSDWEKIERSIRIKGKRTETYFCHPYCSGERGTNENQNRMIRRWIPKGDDIGLYKPEEIARIQEWINNYPRPMFNGFCSREYSAQYI